MFGRRSQAGINIDGPADAQSGGPAGAPPPGGALFEGGGNVATLERPAAPPAKPAAPVAEEATKEQPPISAAQLHALEEARNRVQPELMDRIDIAVASKLPRAELSRQITEVTAEILAEQKIRLNMQEQRDLVDMMLNDMLGLGPLEPLLQDDDITEVLVNGAHQVYVEKGGKLTLSDTTFRDDQHVMNVATRIVSRIGRRLDEQSAMCDARLEDGSRVNIIIPPLAIDGPSISIRKFAKKKLNLDQMVQWESLSPEMATVLKIASRCRLNIVVSGGTGSGKTTMLNALSELIDPAERVVTIEDSAELQMQQPHVVRLETRPPNVEGHGEVSIRDLLKNSLRMRPDRIVVGEVRGGEAIDLLQAMNTGHDGSYGTLHANKPREALTRLENMIRLSGVDIPTGALRTQIASAVDMIVHVSRLRDGSRRTTHITEVIGTEGEIITLQDLFLYQFSGSDNEGKLIGNFNSTGLRPHFMDKAEYFGLDKTLLACMG